MRILTIDFGNTTTKASVFIDGELQGSTLLEVRRAELLIPFIEEYSPEGAISCCVGRNADEFVDDLSAILGFEVDRLDYSTPLPIAVDYRTPKTLGLDRVAAVVGATCETGTALVVDAGTCITLDLVRDNRFMGGNISPGLRLRFRSLNHYTSRLPLVPLEGDIPSFGYDTETAIRSGVINGVLSDIIYAWKEAEALCPGIEVLLTGGDAKLLYPMLQKRGVGVRLAPTLVGRGLERIYLFTH